MQHTTTRWPRKSVLYVKLSSTCRLDAKRWKPLLRSICINATYPSAAETRLRTWLLHDDLYAKGHRKHAHSLECMAVKKMNLRRRNRKTPDSHIRKRQQAQQVPVVIQKAQEILAKAVRPWPAHTGVWVLVDRWADPLLRCLRARERHAPLNTCRVIHLEQKGGGKEREGGGGGCALHHL
jgi:hypothetical protein